MRLSLEKTKQCYVPNDPDGAFVTIKLLTLDELSQCEAASTEMSVNDVTGAAMALDSHKRENEVARRCIKNWSGFYLANGEAIEYSKSNLAKMKDFAINTEEGSVRFNAWVDREHAKFAEEVEKESKDAAKN
jgi:hypothetical protein